MSKYNLARRNGCCSLISHSVMSNSLWSQGGSMPGFPVLQDLLEFAQIHVHWASDVISVTRFSLCLQSFPTSGSFPMSQLFASGSQSFGASASVLPVSTQDWFPLGWTVWFPCSPRDSQESSPIPQFESIVSNDHIPSYRYTSPDLTVPWLLGIYVIFHVLP